MKGKYTLLEVDENNVRMSKFIERKLRRQFEDKKAFYEAENEEDLRYCKKILRPKKDEVNITAPIIDAIIANHSLYTLQSFMLNSVPVWDGFIFLEKGGVVAAVIHIIYMHPAEKLVCMRSKLSQLLDTLNFTGAMVKLVQTNF